jgi:hypothetical protein
LTALERDREKREAVFPRDKREAFALKIVLKQGDRIMMRFNLIAS